MPKELRSKRINICMKPSDYEKRLRESEMHDVSFSEYISTSPLKLYKILKVLPENTIICLYHHDRADFFKDRYRIPEYLLDMTIKEIQPLHNEVPFKDAIPEDDWLSLTLE